MKDMTPLKPPTAQYLQTRSMPNCESILLAGGAFLKVMVLEDDEMLLELYEECIRRCPLGIDFVPFLTAIL